jgi:hypothetical protein
MPMDTIFSAGNLVAITGWLALLAGLFIGPIRKAAFLYAGLVLPLILAVVYVVLLAMSLGGSGEAPDFGSLGGVMALLSSESGATIGWYHYLAFDLVVGTWIARDGLSRGVWPLALIPILFLTFMFGPAGFLTYALVWAIFLRRKHPAAPAPGV